MLDNDVRRIRLANALLFSLPGSPIVYYGDEIGMGDNIWLEDRNGVRTPMQWTGGPHGGFMPSAAQARPYAPLIDSPEYGFQRVNVAAAEADPGSLLHFMRRLIRVRKEAPPLGLGNFHWLDGAPPGVAAFWRSDDSQRILCVHNLRSEPQAVHVDCGPGCSPTLLFGNPSGMVQLGESIRIDIPAYAFAWVAC